MKLLLTIILFVTFQSCNQGKADAKASEATSEMVMDDKHVDGKEKANAEKIVSLNFEALQRNYFQKKTDSVYVINFWATWCKPCVKELPAFEKTALKYSGEKVKVLLVSLDFPDKIESQVIPFIKKNNIQAEVILLDDPDANSWIPKVSPDWSGAIPATIIYNKENRKFYEQSFTFDELETELKTFL